MAHNHVPRKAETGRLRGEKDEMNFVDFLYEIRQFVVGFMEGRNQSAPQIASSWNYINYTNIYDQLT